MEEDIKKEMETEKTKDTNEIEEILELARDVKLTEEELLL